MVDSTTRKERVEAPYYASFVGQPCSKTVEFVEIETETGVERKLTGAVRRRAHIEKRDWVVVGRAIVAAKIGLVKQDERAGIEAVTAFGTQMALRKTNGRS